MVARKPIRIAPRIDAFRAAFDQIVRDVERAGKRVVIRLDSTIDHSLTLMNGAGPRRLSRRRAITSLSKSALSGCAIGEFISGPRGLFVRLFTPAEFDAECCRRSSASMRSKSRRAIPREIALYVPAPSRSRCSSKRRW